MMKNKKIIILVVVLIVIAGTIVYNIVGSPSTGGSLGNETVQAN